MDMQHDVADPARQKPSFQEFGRTDAAGFPQKLRHVVFVEKPHACPREIDAFYIKRSGVSRPVAFCFSGAA
jgi:hypothetical protein